MFPNIELYVILTSPNNQFSDFASEMFSTWTIFRKYVFGNEYRTTILCMSRYETQYDFRIGQLYQGNTKVSMVPENQ